MDSLTEDQSPKCSQKTLWDSSSIISSADKPDGQKPCDLQDGRVMSLLGRCPVRASQSQEPGSESSAKMLVTSGPRLSGSSEHVALDASLVSRFQAVTALLGGTMWPMVLKESVTPLGRRLLTLASSDVRNGDGGSIGLPMLAAREWKDRAQARILASLDRGDGVAKRICKLSPSLRSSTEIVGLNPLFAQWMMGYPANWLSEQQATQSSPK